MASGSASKSRSKTPLSAGPGPAAQAGPASEFSHRTRASALARFGRERFDVLVVGGGITGAAVARDAARRGMKVALVEARDYAYGTSSRSSKLIHGGLRYLENLEFSLVFESLAERALLLRTAPHMVRPLPFYLPVYADQKRGKNLLDLGLWLYDLLALFRTPGFHKRLSAAALLESIPSLKSEGLDGGFRYFDASMWDDVLAIENLRDAVRFGAAVANYVEAVDPRWEGDRITGFRVRDAETGSFIDLRAARTILCGGPWTDRIAGILTSRWRKWLKPSKGVHLVFDSKRLPLPGAVVMSHPTDGRISFAIPRPDFGQGVVIVGTTDASTPADPDAARVEDSDVEYLLALLGRYFPGAKLGRSDILSAYVGVRPLVDPELHPANSAEGEAALQKVSREHQIEEGPGGTVVVAGGKYTTHRTMASEIVEFLLRSWNRDAREGRGDEPPVRIHEPATEEPVNPATTPEAIAHARDEALARGLGVPDSLLERYGSEALALSSSGDGQAETDDPEGFPLLESQLRHAIRFESVIHLEDFYLRRVPLHLCLRDGGRSLARRLAKVWAEERELDPGIALEPELRRLELELDRRDAWRTGRIAAGISAAGTSLAFTEDRSGRP